MGLMSDINELTDYEQLALAELEKAPRSASAAQRRAHLDRASVFATLGEKQRDKQVDGAHDGSG